MHVRVPDCQAGKVLAPNAETELKMVVTEVGGAPIKDRSVLFVAPDGGASGTFSGHDPSGPNYIRVRTDASGVAVVRFTANAQSGAYIIDALVDQTDSQAAFAITNSSIAIPTGASAETVRCQIEADPSLFDVSKQGRVVHGPFLLPTGAKAMSNHEGDPNITTTEPTWFFWIDEHRSADFSHETRWVTVPATAAASAPKVTPHDFWPVLTLPGGTATALKSPALLNASFRSATSTLKAKSLPRTATKLHPLDDGPAVKGDGKSCAILTFGGAETNKVNSVVHMRDFFQNQMGIAVYYKQDAAGNPVLPTMADFEALVAQAKADGCTHIIWYNHSHGSTNTAHDFADGNHGWYEFGRVLKDKAPDTEVSIILVACFSETAIRGIAAQGLKGEIAVSAAYDQLSYNSTGADSKPYFATGLTDEWDDFTAPATTGLQSAFEDMDGSPLHLYRNWSQGPKYFRLNPTPQPLSLPTIEIPCVGQANQVIATIPLPTTDVEASASQDTGSIQISPGGIVALNQDGIGYRPGAASTQKTFYGLAPGEATYTVKIWLLPKGIYEGTGTVKVIARCVNEITVTHGEKDIKDGSVDAIGSRTAGIPFVETYIIKNEGDRPLTVGPVTHPSPGNCKIVSTLPSPVLQGGATTVLTLAITPGAGGFACPVVIATDDTDENPFDFIVAGSTPNAPDIAVAAQEVDVPHTGSHDLGTRLAGATFEASYIVSNAGNEPLVLGESTIPVSSLTNCTAAILTAPTGTLAPGGTATMRLSIQPDGPGAFSFNVAISSNDPNENPFSFSPGGIAGSAPRIAVSGLLEGADAVGKKTIGLAFTRSYTITNSGTASLTLGAVGSATQTNCTATVTQLPTSPVAPAGSTPFTVSVTPVAVGPFSCQVSIASNDAERNPYTFVVSGTGSDECIYSNGMRLIDGKKVYRVPTNVGCSGDQVCAAAGLSCVGVPVLNTPSAACVAFHPGTTVKSDLNGWRQSVYCDGTKGGLACNGEVQCHDCPQCGSQGLQCNDPNSSLLAELYVECQ